MSEPASRRLFFALWPEGEVRDALRAWQKGCLSGNVRPTHRDDLHLTVHFLGQVDAGRIDRLLALADQVHVPRFDLVLDRLGHFARPRVLWAGPATVPAELRNLHADLASGLRDCGFEPESRPYRPHVTLARKVRERPEVADLPAIHWTVGHWALVESRPGRVPLYAPLNVWEADAN